MKKKRFRNRARKNFTQIQTCNDQSQFESLPAEILEQVSDYLQDPDFRSLNLTCCWIRTALRNRTVMRSRSILQSSLEGSLSSVIFRCKLLESRPGFDQQTMQFRKFPKTLDEDLFELFPKYGYPDFDYDVAEYGNVPACLYLQCLHNACRNGHLSIVKYFIERNVVNDVTGIGNRAVKLAIVNGHVPVVKFLLSLPELSSYIREDSGSIRGACFNGHLEMVTYLSKNYDLSLTTRLMGFQAASSAGRLSLVTYLITYIDPEDYYLGFHQACAYGHLHLARYLSPKVQAGILNSGFTLACKNGRLNIVKFLSTDTGFKFRINPDYGHYFDSALIQCLYSRKESVLKYLLKISFWQGCADPKTTYNKAFIEACSIGAMESIRILVTLPEVQPAYQDNKAFRQAIKNDWLPVVQFLLTGNNGQEFPGVRTSETMKKAVKKSSNHCLHNIDIIKFLSRYPEAQVFDKKNIIQSVKHDNPEFLKFLLKSGSVNIPERLLTSCIRIASKYGLDEIYGILISISSKYESANRALAFQVACDNLRMGMTHFIENETKTYSDGTSKWALDISMNGNRLVERALIRKRALFFYFCRLKNKDGSNRIDFARENHRLISVVFSRGHMDLVEFLLTTYGITSKYRNDFIIKFISESVKLYLKTKLNQTSKLVRFEPLFSYMIPLHHRHTSSVLSGAVHKPYSVDSEAWKFLRDFRKQAF